MSDPPETRDTELEEVRLSLVPGTGDAQNNSTCGRVVAGRAAAASCCCCDDKNHRRLAVCSIICGLSCIGIKALIYSVKAETATDPEAAATFSRRSKKCGIISIVTWVAILTLTPLLMALVSYLLTLQD